MNSKVITTLSFSKIATGAVLLAKILLPAPTELVLCLIAAGLLTGADIVLLSLNFGTFLPSVVNGYWAVDYTNYVVGPLERVTNNEAVARAVGFILWGFIGFLVYSLIKYAGGNYRSWREVEDSVQMPYAGYVVKHPGQRAFMAQTAFRIGVIAVATALVVAGRLLFHRLFAANDQLFIGQLTTGKVEGVGLAILGWTAVAHIGVIFARLYEMRPRVFDRQ